MAVTLVWAEANVTWYHTVRKTLNGSIALFPLNKTKMGDVKEVGHDHPGKMV